MAEREKKGQIKGPVQFQGEMIKKKQKHIDKILKSFSPKSLVQFQPTLQKASFSDCGIHVFSNKGPHIFRRGDNNEIAKIFWRNFKNIFLHNHWYTGPISTKLDIKHTGLR